MNDALTTLARPSVSIEVQEFAAEKGVSQYLDAVIDLTRRAYPSSSMCVSVGEDAEDESHRYIALDVKVKDLPVQEVLDSQRIWSTELGKVCPDHRSVYFVLGWL